MANINLQDSSGNIWAVGATANGRLTTTPASGSPQPIVLFLRDEIGHVWQVGVEVVTGRLTTVPGASSDQPQYRAISIGSTPNYNMFVDTLGLLQSGLGGVLGAWVPNGYGAGTDNSVVGGGGGFMAYPQPPAGPKASFNPPENDGQFGPVQLAFVTSTANYFTVSNPGRSANQ